RLLRTQRAEPRTAPRMRAVAAGVPPAVVRVKTCGRGAPKLRGQSRRWWAMKRSMGWGIANGIAAGALWGVVFLAPAMLHSFNAAQLAAGRYLVYGLVAVVLLAPRWRQLRSVIGAPEWRGLLWLSLAGNLVYFLLLANAVQWAGGAAASLIV